MTTSMVEGNSENTVQAIRVLENCETYTTSNWYTIEKGRKHSCPHCQGPKAIHNCKQLEPYKSANATGVVASGSYPGGLGDITLFAEGGVG